VFRAFRGDGSLKCKADEARIRLHADPRPLDPGPSARHVFKTRVELTRVVLHHVNGAPMDNRNLQHDPAVQRLPPIAGHR
jgi:hypothetical protein